MKLKDKRVRFENLGLKGLKRMFKVFQILFRFLRNPIKIPYTYYMTIPNEMSSMTYWIECLEQLHYKLKHWELKLSDYLPLTIEN